MALQAGQRLAHYEVREKIGAGGMGEVYRATDTRLARDVALKALPDEVARDPERLARFRREAQLLAALNHPNIAAIHGLEEIDGGIYMALELVPGDDLAARLRQGPIPADEAIGVALQIAGALEDAHEQGIIHRDLKPANIKVTPDGKVKVLDFGLAKALEPVAGSTTNASLSPTMTAAATRAGIILGTAAYMSPEQARGANVDRRADIWAFGCVLLEMLSGRNAFSEPTVSDTLASILKSEPDWNALPAGTTGALRALLRRCLQKDAKNRLRDMGEARIALQEILAGVPGDATAPVGPFSPARVTGRWPMIAIAGIVLSALATWLVMTLTRSAPAAGATRKFELVSDGLQAEIETLPAISPDGRRIVYAADERLWIREIDSVEPRPLHGAEGAQYPFWSPDSATVGYVRGVDLKSVPAAGGESATIALSLGSFTSPAAVTWEAGGRIVYTRGDTGLFEIRAAGDEPRVLLSLEAGESDFHQPWALPGDRGILFVVHRATTGPDTIAVLADGKRKTVITIEGEMLYRPVYTSGHIVYRRRGTRGGLWAVPFSLERLETAGAPFLVTQDGDFPSAAGDGTLLYVRGAAAGQQQMVWVGRDGRIEGTVSQPQTRIGSPEISPDGGRVAVMGQENEAGDIWIHDIARSTRTRLTFTSQTDWDPAWMPDGQHVVFWDGVTRAISWKPADGTGSIERLVAQELADSGVPSIASDGSQMVFWSRPSNDVDDIWSMSLSGDRAARPIVQSSAREDHPRLSPDGRHLLYVSNESGGNEVYLTRFPSGEGKWQVSTKGGSIPRWDRRGDRIYYVQDEDRDRAIVEVPIALEPAVRLGAPVRLFGTKAADINVDESRYDVSPDGERFLMVKSLRPEGERPAIVLVDNWISEFGRNH